MWRCEVSNAVPQHLCRESLHHADEMRAAASQSECLRLGSHIVAHLKMVEKDEHAIKNFDRTLPNCLACALPCGLRA